MPQDAIGVVIDTGSAWTKAGFSSESFPRCIIPTAVGRFRDTRLLDGIQEFYFGREAVKHRGLTHMTWPIRDGFIDNWNEMEKFWHHIFYKEIHVAPEEAKLMSAIHPLTNKKDKEKMSEVLFESFAIHDLYLAPSPALVLYASGRTTGVVWECGDSCSYVTPVFEGFPLKHATAQSKINGHVLTMYMQKLLSEIGYSFTTPRELDILDDIKEKLCYVINDYETEILDENKKKEKVQYHLPDGQEILIGCERFQCPELVFQTRYRGEKCPNIVDNIDLSISRCDMDHRYAFYKNIVLSGGSTMFTGLTARLNLELKKRMAHDPKVEIFIDELPSRNVTPWTGGSILASLDSIQGFWMTKQEYEDGGADRVHYKFF